MKSYIIVALVFSAISVYQEARGEDLAKLVPIDPTQFQGKSIKDYPNLFFVRSTKYFNFFWSAGTNCADHVTPETIVDQAKAQRVSQTLENEVEPLISAFEARAKNIFPEWKIRISDKLYPIDVDIELLAPSTCDGASIDRQISINDAQGNVVGNREYHPTIEAGGNYTTTEELKGIQSVTMHELGHLILRTLGYPIYKVNRAMTYGPLEEAFADFTALIGTNGSPFIGLGLGTILQNEYCSGLGSAPDALSKLRIETNCRPISNNALRDLSLPLQYPNLYKLPEYHNIAAHLNAMMYRLTQIAGVSDVFQHFTNLFLRSDRSIYDAEIDLPLQKVVRKLVMSHPDKKSEIEAATASLHWRPANSSRSTLTVGQAQKINDAIEFDIAGSRELKTHLFPNDGIEIVSIVLSDNRGTIYSYPDIPLLWHPILQFIEDASCSSTRIDCVCGNSSGPLAVEGVFLDKNLGVSRTAKQTLPMELLNSCYRVGAGER